VVRVTCYIRPHRLEEVKSAVAALGVTGMSVADVRGAGNSKETAGWFAGDEALVALPIRSRIEVVAPDELQEEIVQAMISAAHTGEPDDGKIFVERILEAVRVRTGEKGDAAV
jgi:nitrogen regulatory protein P-II 1